MEVSRNGMFFYASLEVSIFIWWFDWLIWFSFFNRLCSIERPLKVEVIVDPAQQVVAAPVVVAAQPAAAARGGGPSRGRGRGRGGRRGGRNGPPREKKTAEDLDAEMEGESSS